MFISKYSILLKVVEMKSFTKAAQYYQYTQSAISQMVRSLEKEFGITLFFRTKNGIEPTEECKALLPYIRQIVIGDQSLHEQISELHNLQQGTIRIGSYLSISTHLLPGVIHSFQKEYPNISFELYQEDDITLLNRLTNGSLDICVMCNPGKREFSFSNELFKDPFMIVLPEDHPLAKKDCLSINEIKDEPLISLEVGYREYYEEMYKIAGIRRGQAAYEMIDDLSVIAMVEKHHGVAILPEYVTTRNPFHIKAVPIDPPYYRTVGIVSRKHTYHSWAVKCFIDHMENSVKRSDY